MKALENPGNIAPKLGHRPGQKVRSGVAVPAHLLKRAEAPRLATVDDWDELAAAPDDAAGSAHEDEIVSAANAPAKSVDSGNFDFMFSDDEAGDVRNDGGDDESEDELVIEP